MRLWALYLDWPVNVQRLQVYQAKQRNTYFQTCRAHRLVKWSSTKLKQNHVLKINHDIFVNNIIRGTITCILLSFLILSESPQHATKNKAKLACCGRKPMWISGSPSPAPLENRPVALVPPRILGEATEGSQSRTGGLLGCNRKFHQHMLGITNISQQT